MKSLTIFQKSAHWMAPNDQFRKPIPEESRFLLREVPVCCTWYRRMETYYRNTHGRVVVNSPYLINPTYFDMTRTADLADFVVEPRHSQPAQT